MIRIIAKLFAVTVTLVICMLVQPSFAGNVTFVSAISTSDACTQSQPCSQILEAVQALGTVGGQVVCLTPTSQGGTIIINNIGPIAFDCPSSAWNAQFELAGSGVFKFQHIDFSGLGTISNVILITGGGTLIFDDCTFDAIAGTALIIQPSSPLTLVVTNSRISNNAAGVVIKPTTGGSVKATFNGVTIVNNNGGGLKTDSTNGPVSVDISNSTISNNAGNGMNAVSPAGPVLSGGLGGPNMLNIRNSVIAGNGSSGIQANGTVSAVLVNNTLLDSNTAGAISAVNSGRVLTYGNNSIVGTPGSGFTGTAPLQ
jgi:Right handed beta helix region